MSDQGPRVPSPSPGELAMPAILSHTRRARQGVQVISYESDGPVVLLEQLSVKWRTPKTQVTLITRRCLSVTHFCADTHNGSLHICSISWW